MDDRKRKLSDALGGSLWTYLYAAPEGQLLDIAEITPTGTNRLTMDLPNASVLAGFIMAVRTAAPKPLPPEQTRGQFASSYRYVATPVPAVRVEQDVGSRLDIRSSFWDLLCAELVLVGALARAEPGNSAWFTSGQASLTAH